MNGAMVKPSSEADDAKSRTPAALPKPVALIGLMGAGKSKVGRMLAKRLGVDFADSDRSIEESAGMDIPGIFESYGEAAFRDLEARVLGNMLGAPPRVIATGGGAFMDEGTRSLIKTRALSVWLKAEPATLAGRISNPAKRPLLKDRDPEAVLTALAEERYPVYAEADLTVDTDGLALEAAVVKVEREFLEFLRQSQPGAPS